MADKKVSIVNTLLLVLVCLAMPVLANYFWGAYSFPSFLFGALASIAFFFDARLRNRETCLAWFAMCCYLFLLFWAFAMSLD